ncbi:MAG: MBL fold metallo-hydrolase [Bacteroidota bacterium]|nr:MBL fold metallo-hydrolase [Bacteroidota bacterium]
MKRSIWITLLIIFAMAPSLAQSKFESDVVKTSSGKLTITFIGHASLVFDFKGTIIHVDPWTKFTDYVSQPKADIILITHNHPDHLDVKAIEAVSKKETQIVLNDASFASLKKGLVMKNGEKKTIAGISIEAVPAYNTTPGHEMYHPKGRDNGYILTFGNKRVYIAGDTENIPEMASLKNIDIAFLPMNLPYTMTPAQVADAVHKFNPKILYPYHFGETDVTALTKLLASDKKVEVRVRSLK